MPAHGAIFMFEESEKQNGIPIKVNKNTVFIGVVFAISICLLRLIL